MKKKILVILICIFIIFIIFSECITSSEQKKIIENKNYSSYKLRTVTDEYFVDVNENIYNSMIVKIPSSWDWRKVDGEDWTTPIRDQYQDECGSCWAFGAIGGLESNYKIWKEDPNLDIDLSEQYILSCSSGSCNGWYLSKTLNWIKHNGIIFEDCMPYQADDTIPCESKCNNWRDQLFGIKDYHRVPGGNINSIKEALFNHGPLPATMEVYGDFYPEWNGDVYQQTSNDFIFGHVVTIVGYDDNWGNEDQGYWICKNSWGTDWGEDGWFRIAYGECNIENSVYYLEGPNYPPFKPEKPTGKSTGKTDVKYNFSSSCLDPDNNKLNYLFDWGDGNDSDWLGPYESGEKVYANYSWKFKGTYQVKVKTMDFIGPNTNDYGIESEWSDPLTFQTARSRTKHTSLLSLLQKLPTLYHLFQRFLKI